MSIIYFTGSESNKEYTNDLSAKISRLFKPFSNSSITIEYFNTQMKFSPMYILSSLILVIVNTKM